VIDTRDMSDARVSVESSLNGNFVKERVLPDQDTLSIEGAPTRAPLSSQKPFLGRTLSHCIVGSSLRGSMRILPWPEGLLPGSGSRYFVLLGGLWRKP
jgi:hypothetical protein